MTTYILGVDLGQSADFTALTVLECKAVRAGEGEHRSSRKNHYAVRHLERLPIGTPYPKQVERIKEIKRRLGEGSALVADATGVGAPVIDMLEDARLSPIAVTITGGDNVTRDGRAYRVPKRHLVSTVKILAQGDRLRVAPELPSGQVLANELQAFKVSITLSGHDKYGNDQGQWREAPNDDMVLATALACWYGEQQRDLHILSF